MNIRYMNFVFLAGLCITVFLGLGCAALLAFILSSPIHEGLVSSIMHHSQWLIYRNIPYSSHIPLWTLGGLLALDLVIIISFPGLKKTFQRSHSPEIFFFSIFLFSLSFESLKIGTVVSLLFDKPIFYGVVFTRAIYLGRIIGLLCLLFSSLYAIKMRYNHFGVLLGITILVAFAFSISIPIDPTVYMVNLLYKLGEERGLLFVTISLSALVIINFFGAAHVKSSPHFTVTAIASVILQSGREVVFFTVEPPFLFAGILAILIGKVVFIKQIERFYLWV